MTMQKQISDKLLKSINLSFYDIANESYMHNVPPGSESHFKLTIVSDDFAGLSLIKRHQFVYSILAEEMRSGIHALALHTLTPSEFKQRNGQTQASPLCLGGSK